MAFALPMAGASLLGSFLQSNSSKKAAQQNQSAESAIDNQLLSVYNKMMGTYNQVATATNPAGDLQTAKNFYTSEVEGGLSPAVSGAAQSQFQQESAQGLATLKNQLGPYTPNVAGLVSEFQNNTIEGGISLDQQLAAMNQNVRAAGAQGLESIGSNVLNFGQGIMSDVASGLGALGGQFQQAGEFNATNAGANNPFASLTNLAAMFPQLFAGGGFNNSGAPGQSGLGTTGGTGTGTSGGGIGQTA